MVGKRLTEKTTNDPEFLEKYKVKIKSKGVDSIFPTTEQGIVLHYICRVRDTGEEIENTYKEKPKSFQLNNFKVLKCVQNVVNRMCLGEKLVFECPMDEMSYNRFNQYGKAMEEDGRPGIPFYVTEEEVLAFEVELQGLSDMSTFKTLGFS